MFIVIYSFEIIPDKKNVFLDCWRELTKLIYKYENSLGSRIHKQSENIYVAYAQWPNAETFENSGKKLPEKAIEIRRKMKEVCFEIKILNKLEVIEDLLDKTQQQ